MALTTQRKPLAHHKKAHGGHHRHVKHYLKTYSPYLPLLLLVIVGLAINSLWSLQSKQVLGANTSLTAKVLLVNSNRERVAQNIGSLALNEQLSSAAQAKAYDMAARNYWSHDAPDGTTPWSFMETAGYAYQIAGENLAFGFSNPDAVVTGWMNSPEHRDNILDPGYKDVGFGIVQAPNYLGKGPATIVVALYGQQASSSIDITMTVNGASPQVAGATTTNQPYRNVSRLAAITNGAEPWSVAVVSVLILTCLAVLVTRHARAWHRVIVKSEAFVLKHKTLDVLVLSVLIIGVLLTRTAGFIG